MSSLLCFEKSKGVIVLIILSSLSRQPANSFFSKLYIAKLQAYNESLDLSQASEYSLKITGYSIHTPEGLLSIARV